MKLPRLIFRPDFCEPSARWRDNKRRRAEGSRLIDEKLAGGNSGPTIRSAACQSTPPALQLTQPVIPAPRKHFQAPSGSFLYTMSTVPRACTGAPPGDVTNEAVY